MTDTFFAKVKNRPVRLMLINTPFRDMYGPIKVAAGRYFPLSLGYIASYCLSKGYDVQLIDPEPQNIGYEGIKKKVKEYQPDIIGLTCATPNFGNAVTIAAMAKEVCGAIIVAGGVHVTTYPEPALRTCKDIDVITLREGEETMDELCQYLQGNIESLDKIQGIVFRGKDAFVNTGLRPFITDLDKLPFPAYHLVDMSLYKPNVYTCKGSRTATIMTSRGCPGTCIYCASHKVLGRGFRPNSPEYVLRLITHLVETYHANHIIFEDDVFTFDKERAKKICRALIEKGLNKKIQWCCFSRVTSAEEELFSLMKEAGCYAVSFGIESGSDVMLKNMKKGTTTALNRKGLELCKKAGMRSIAFFVFGTPGETKETIEETIHFALETRPTMAFFNILSPYPGTELFEYSFTKEEADKIHDWKDFVSIGINPQLKHTNLTQDELQNAAASAFRRFYYNPKGMYGVLSSISSFNEFKELSIGAYGLCLQMGEWMRRATLAKFRG
ncbi:MAG: radical SAM protein [Patescibacteria group bacterium]